MIASPISLFTTHPVIMLSIIIIACICGNILRRVAHALPIMLDHHWFSQAHQILGHTHPDISPCHPYRSPLCQACSRNHHSPTHFQWWFGNRCILCENLISLPRYTIELACISLVLLAIANYGVNIQGLYASIFILMVSTAALIDYETFILPDCITLPLMWLGITLSFWSVFIPLTTAVSGAIIGYCLIWSVATIFRLLYKKEGIGMGDAKLLAAIMTWIPLYHLPTVLLIAGLSGITTMLVQRLLSQKKLSRQIPFGPHLTLAAIAILCGFPAMVSI